MQICLSLFSLQRGGTIRREGFFAYIKKESRLKTTLLRFRAWKGIKNLTGNLCNGMDDWTGPLACLSFSSVMLVEKVRLQTGNTAFQFSFSQWKLGGKELKCFILMFKHQWNSIIEWMLPFWVHFWVQYSLLLQYEIL